MISDKSIGVNYAVGGKRSKVSSVRVRFFHVFVFFFLYYLEAMLGEVDRDSRRIWWTGDVDGGFHIPTIHFSR